MWFYYVMPTSSLGLFIVLFDWLIDSSFIHLASHVIDQWPQSPQKTPKDYKRLQKTSANVYINTIRVDLEGDLCLRYTSRRWRDASAVKFLKKVMVPFHWTFTLEDMNKNGRLIVLRSWESFSGKRAYIKEKNRENQLRKKE